MSKHHEEVVERMADIMAEVEKDDALSEDGKAIVAMLVNLTTMVASIDRRLWALESYMTTGQWSTKEVR